MRRLPSILLALSVLLLAGCATKTRSDALTTTINAYGSTLRWGDFQSAAQFIEPAMRAAHPVNALDLARYQQVRVTEYLLVGVVPGLNSVAPSNVNIAGSAITSVQFNNRSFSISL